MTPATTILTPTDPELQRAWATFPDPAYPVFPEEVLEYLWTQMRFDPEEEACWVHVFKHRVTPVSLGWSFRTVPAPVGWVPPRQEEVPR